MNRDILFIKIKDEKFINFDEQDLEQCVSDALLKISRVTNRAFNYKVATVFNLSDVELESANGPEPIGTQYFLSGKEIYQMLDQVDEQDIAPIVCFVLDPRADKRLINICYKMLNKYGVVNCMVVNDNNVGDYIFHELAHAIHEVIRRQGVELPDTQDQDIVLASAGSSSTPEHQELVNKNLMDCIPHIDLLYTEPKEGKLAFAKNNLIILLSQKVIELMKLLLKKKKDKKYFKQYALDMAKKYGVDGKVMSAVIEAESGFNPAAVNINTDEHRSADFGICQGNSRYGVGAGKLFPSSEYVFNHPEECIEEMAKMGQKGKQNLGCAYTNGSYKKFLNNY